MGASTDAAPRPVSSEMAEKAEMSEMPELSEGMSSVSVSEMEPCPLRASI
jgi:hypothetical protein